MRAAAAPPPVGTGLIVCDGQDTGFDIMGR